MTEKEIIEETERMTEAAKIALVSLVTMVSVTMLMGLCFGLILGFLVSA